MDYLFIFKYVALAFGSATIVFTAYYLTKAIGITALSSEGIYNNIPLLILEVIGSSFIASVWLCAVASWNIVAVLFTVILIPALLGLWRAVVIKKRSEAINK